MNPKNTAIMKIAKNMYLASNFMSPIIVKRFSLSLYDVPMNQFLERYKRISLSELYHENTKLRRYQKEVSISTQIFSTPEMLASTSLAAPKRSGKKVPLPKNDLSLNENVGDVLRTRRSIREFGKNSISIMDLSKLLYYTNGITERLQYKLQFRDVETKVDLPLRASPSGGALYPIDIYVAVLNVQNITRAIYFYDVEDHSLVLINEEVEKLISSFVPFSQETSSIKDSCLIIMFVANFFRTKLKYGERGYRYVLQESGHMAQNVYIASTALKLAAVAVDGFYDDEINSILGVDGVEEAIVYAVVVGNQK
ncbi:MAG: SagB/ThcOx family dehydrogenase [Saccharolobus sp.]